MLWNVRKRLADFIVNPCGRPAAGMGMDSKGPLFGDRDIEWSWIVSKMPDGPGEALDFGWGGSALGLAAVFRGYRVTALDLRACTVPYAHERLRFVQGDLLTADLPLCGYRLIINCSVVEHVGLAGRYGIREAQADADLETMRRLRALVAPAGRMMMTIPVGKDATIGNLHRVYGHLRLPLLVEGWLIEQESYWARNPAGKWTEVSQGDAFRVVPSEVAYALGLFVLSPGADVVAPVDGSGPP